MSNLEKYYGQPVQQAMVQFAGMGPSQPEASVDAFGFLKRRWLLILITFAVISSIGVPAVWFLVRPQYETSAAIRISPIVYSILFSDSESDRAMPNYQNFMYTQSELMSSNQVLNRVAEDVLKKKLEFFRNQPDSVTALRLAIQSETIKIQPVQRTELIKITMVGRNPKEAEQIVNSFVRAYMAIEASNEAQGGDQKLAVLEEQQQTLSAKMLRQRKGIRELAEVFGTTALNERQEMMMAQVKNLQQELLNVETRRIALESQLQSGKDASLAAGGEAVAPTNLLKMRYEFVNADLTVQALTQRVAQLEQEVVVANQTLQATNPRLQNLAELLDAMKKNLDERREQVADSLDNIIEQELARNSKLRMVEVDAELRKAVEYEKRIRQKLAEQNTETIEIGRRQLAIQEQQEQLESTRQMYDTVSRRIQELEMERKRPARISVAYEAASMPVLGKRNKFLGVVLFSSMACGMFLGLIVDRTDSRLRTPDDVVKCAGVRIIGTTVEAPRHKDHLLVQRLADDYQVIRANMSMFNNEIIPHKLVITSARAREGKTTFSVNLAASVSKSGKKVLLIDGDLRKPEIDQLLNVQGCRKGLRELLLGRCRLEDAIHKLSYGLHFLTIERQNPADSFELLANPAASVVLEEISRHYDHVIIDTSPILIVPDGLLWAKMSDAVVVASMAGHSESPDLKDAIERLSQINAKVLGVVLNNVKINNSYNRYGYDDYYSSDGKPKTHTSTMREKSIILPLEKDEDKEKPDTTSHRMV